MAFSTLAERQILKAQAEGQFDTLKGAGKPLDQLDGSPDAIGFRIMAEAGALPREIALRKAVEAQAQTLREAVEAQAQTLREAATENDRRRAAARLAELQLCLDIEAEARRRFQRD